MPIIDLKVKISVIYFLYLLYLRYIWFSYTTNVTSYVHVNLIGSRMYLFMFASLYLTTSLYKSPGQCSLTQTINPHTLLIAFPLIPCLFSTFSKEYFIVFRSYSLRFNLFLFLSFILWRKESRLLMESCLSIPVRFNSYYDIYVTLA